MAESEICFKAIRKALSRGGDFCDLFPEERTDTGITLDDGKVVGAKGFAISKDRLGSPLKNMVVAGNFYELITRIDAKASDRRILVHEPFSSPSILISDLSVSGK